MITTKDTALVVIDVQEKLVPAMHNKEALLDNLKKMVKGALILGLPILLTEQNPAGLGPTAPEIAELLPDEKPVSKFSLIKAVNCQNILIVGMETHVCVYQTAADLANLNYDVQVVADAVASRTPENKQIGLEKSKAAGAGITSTEIALFELLKIAKGDKFKEIIKIVK
jgi:nicotinamidase-related amidase